MQASDLSSYYELLYQPLYIIQYNFYCTYISYVTYVTYDMLHIEDEDNDMQCVITYDGTLPDELLNKAPEVRLIPTTHSARA